MLPSCNYFWKTLLPRQLLPKTAISSSSSSSSSWPSSRRCREWQSRPAAATVTGPTACCHPQPQGAGECGGERWPAALPLTTRQLLPLQRLRSLLRRIGRGLLACWAAAAALVAQWQQE
jgi:hypothetical protein